MLYLLLLQQAIVHSQSSSSVFSLKTIDCTKETLPENLFAVSLVESTESASQARVLQGCHLIPPSPHVEALLAQSIESVEQVVVAPQGTTMTATKFFGSKKASVNANAAADKTKAAKPATKPEPKPPAATKPADSKPSKQEDEKENATIGNADDFMGDEEESDDDDVVLAVPSKKRAVIQDDSPVQQPPGAMDDLAQVAPKKDTTRAVHRRKKLVQKTTTDDKGYFHTETQEVWEDVVVEEVAPAAVPKAAAAKKGKKPSAMKQGNLMGFFKK